VRRVGLENSFFKKVYLKYYHDVDMKAYDLIRGDGIRNVIAYTKIIQDFWYGGRFNPHERMFYFKNSVARVHLSPLRHGYMYVPDFIFFG
jgi:hypothetical protein